MDSRTKQIAESFGCAYTLFEKGSEPWEVEEAYMEALKEGEKGGFWPAVLLVDAYVEEWLEIVAQDGYNREQIIANQAAMERKSWQNAWRNIWKITKKSPVTV